MRSRAFTGPKRAKSSKWSRNTAVNGAQEVTAVKNNVSSSYSERRMKPILNREVVSLDLESGYDQKDEKSQFGDNNRSFDGNHLHLENGLFIIRLGRCIIRNYIVL